MRRKRETQINVIRWNWKWRWFIKDNFTWVTCYAFLQQYNKERKKNVFIDDLCIFPLAIKEYYGARQTGSANKFFLWFYFFFDCCQKNEFFLSLTNNVENKITTKILYAMRYAHNQFEKQNKFSFICGNWFFLCWFAVFK